MARALTFGLTLVTVLMNGAFGQEPTKINPVSSLPPVSSAPANVHRLVVYNGGHVTIGYFAQPGTPEQAVVELQAKAKEEADAENKRLFGDANLPVERIIYTNVRPDNTLPASLGMRITAILKSGARITGIEIRSTDLHLVLRTDDGDDFDIVRSEIAAISKRR
jgi:hypothetical protein